MPLNLSRRTEILSDSDLRPVIERILQSSAASDFDKYSTVMAFGKAYQIAQLSTVKVVVSLGTLNSF